MGVGGFEMGFWWVLWKGFDDDSDDDGVIGVGIERYGLGERPREWRGGMIWCLCSVKRPSIHNLPAISTVDVLTDNQVLS